MTIRVRKLAAQLKEQSAKVLAEDPATLAATGRLSLLLDEASTVITNQQDDLDALRQQGTDHG